jgi:hypothetical protein
VATPAADLQAAALAAGVEREPLVGAQQFAVG